MTTKFPFILSICMLCIFTGCQKEFIIDDLATAGSATGTSEFNFVGAPANCPGLVLNGNFKAGVPVDTSNYVIAQVNVTDTGTYKIVSSGINGIHFSATGTFTATGLQTVVFIAAGKPVTGGTFDFKLGTIAACSFTITFLPAAVVNNGNCKSCVYYPFCVGSKYEYIDSMPDPLDPLAGVAVIQARNIEYLSSIDTTIDARVYQKMTFFDGMATSSGYVNCSNNETRSVAYNVQSTTSGNVVIAFNSIELKADAAIGSSWTDSSIMTGGNKMYRKHTITQKGFSRTILGVTYNDIIKVSVAQSVLYAIPGIGLMEAGVTEYYIAKGIGLVETFTYADNPLTGQTYTVYHSLLKNYFIP